MIYVKKRRKFIFRKSKNPRNVRYVFQKLRTKWWLRNANRYNKGLHSRDTDCVDIIIHNLKLEKEQIEIDKRSRETQNFPISVGIVSATFTALLSFILTSVTKECNGLAEYIAFYGTVVVSFIGLYVFSKKIFDSMKEDKLRVLKNREKLNFLEFCIEEYTKKKQQ